MIDHDQTKGEPAPTGKASSAKGGLDQWLAALQHRPPPSRGPVAVVCFRNTLWAEWSIYTACYLYQMGYLPVVIYSGREMDRIYALADAGGTFWPRVKRSGLFRFVDVEDYFPKPGDDLSAHRDRAVALAHQAVAHDRRVEIDDVVSKPEYADAVRAIGERLASYSFACEGALREVAPPRCICPSGLIGWSGAFAEVAARRQVPTAFVEFWVIRPGHMIWNIDRPATDHDLPGWMSVMGPWDQEKAREIEALMRFRDTGAKASTGWLADFHNAQRSQDTTPLPPPVAAFLARPGPRFLLGTNVVGDSATLGRATIFRSQKHWLESVCAFFKERPGLNLIVRAHPDEATIRHFHVRLGEVAASAAGGAPNILVVHGREDVNTFSIARQVQAGLVWVSTLGVDLVARGKPVLVAARAQYGQLGIGVSCHSAAAYFARLEALSETPVAPPPEMVRMSLIYQWIVFRRLSLEATTARMTSRAYRLEPPGARLEQETFYRILVGELDDKGRDWPASGAPAGG